MKGLLNCFTIQFQEDNAVFVMTNMIISPNQTQSTCPEDPKFPNVRCTKDSDCPPLKPVENGHGESFFLYKFRNCLGG